jgi:hypothetical protein
MDLQRKQEKPRQLLHIEKDQSDTYPHLELVHTLDVAGNHSKVIPQSAIP